MVIVGVGDEDIAMGFENEQLVMFFQHLVETFQIHALREELTLGVAPCGHIDKDSGMVPHTVYDLLRGRGLILGDKGGALGLVKREDEVTGVAKFNATLGRNAKRGGEEVSLMRCGRKNVVGFAESLRMAEDLFKACALVAGSNRASKDVVFDALDTQTVP